jgi:inner membrane protein
LDPLTHLLTGACLSRAGFNRKTALATTTMVLAAEFPDLDIVAYVRGPVVGFDHHRGFTHTLLGTLFDAAVVVGAVYLLYTLHRRWRVLNPARPHPRWGLLYIYGVIAAFSHILLDFTNSYGVRPFAPFSWRWYSWDIVNIIEPLMLAVLILGLITPRLFALVSEEIGERRKAGPRGRGGAIFALMCIVILWGVRDFEHRRAVAALNSLLYNGKEPLRVSAFPYSLTPFRWHGVVETEDHFEELPVNSRRGEVDREGRGRVRYKPQETQASLAAKRSYLGRIYLDWAQYPVTEMEQTTDPNRAYIVRFLDLRYDYPERRSASLRCAVELDRNLKVVAELWGRRSQAVVLEPSRPSSSNNRSRTETSLRERGN